MSTGQGAASTLPEEVLKPVFPGWGGFLRIGQVVVDEQALFLDIGQCEKRAGAGCRFAIADGNLAAVLQGNGGIVPGVFALAAP